MTEVIILIHTRYISFYFKMYAKKSVQLEFVKLYDEVTVLVMLLKYNTIYKLQRHCWEWLEKLYCIWGPKWVNALFAQKNQHSAMMKREFVSQNRQMEPTSGLRECILKDGHRCGACHNVSDAKVRIGKHFVKWNRLAR